MRGGYTGVNDKCVRNCVFENIALNCCKMAVDVAHAEGSKGHVTERVC